MRRQENFVYQGGWKAARFKYASEDYTDSWPLNDVRRPLSSTSTERQSDSSGAK